MQRLPGVLVCDDDSNLHRAAAIVWPSIFVILCVWHFKKNIRKKVSLILGALTTEFCTRVSNLLSADPTRKYVAAIAALDDPTLQWNRLSGANADNIADAICLCKSVASKQAPCFLDVFHGLQLASSRAEQTNSVLRRLGANITIQVHVAIDTVCAKDHASKREVRGQIPAIFRDSRDPDTVAACAKLTAHPIEKWRAERDVHHLYTVSTEVSSSGKQYFAVRHRDFPDSPPRSVVCPSSEHAVGEPFVCCAKPCCRFICSCRLPRRGGFPCRHII